MIKDTFAVAISPDKTYLVLQKGVHYALLNRSEGVTEDTYWRDKSLVSQMVIKGHYKKFKKPVKYKGLTQQAENH